jgi:hypothetical protein
MRALKWLLVMGLVAVVSGVGAVPAALAAGKEDGSSPKPQKMVFIHFHSGYAGVPAIEARGPKPKGFYDLIAKGFRWKADPPEAFVVNPSGSGLADEFVLDALTAAMAEWETYGGGSIFGSAALGTAEFDDTHMDEVNAISFGALPEGIIAVTVYWGVWWGPPSGRYMAETDILFNTLYYTWGDAVTAPDPSVIMDLQNIATHELGHAAGMDDLYKPPAAQETMFGYSTEGEIKKRTLDIGDQIGIYKLYNE